MSKIDLKDVQSLTTWYLQNQRALPWRQSKDPYRIWISEVMLQQTTVVAVIPYYEKFLKLFPSVQKLAQAPESQVLAAWAGLGYYSRARNLHKAAKILAKKFPQTASELIELPGFGPYTSAAVASIAFEDSVGVLDGNVIRVLSRKNAFQTEWWKSTEKNYLQALSDKLVQSGTPSIVNQALMELGATICTPHKPQCFLCPWVKSCKAFSEGVVDKIPLSKPRKNSENWIYEVEFHLKNKKIALIENLSGPFLKKQWVFPGAFKQVKAKPKKFDVRHSITHHDIFVQLSKTKKLKNSNTSLKWVPIEKVSEINPSSLLQKIIKSIAALD